MASASAGASADTPAGTGRTITSSIPARLDRLPWSRHAVDGGEVAGGEYGGGGVRGGDGWPGGSAGAGSAYVRASVGAPGERAESVEPEFAISEYAYSVAPRRTGEPSYV